MTIDLAAPLLPRLRTGIAGFEEISAGGLPQGSVTLVTGPAGSGKTVLALQFLAEGIRQFQEPGVFVTFGEPTVKLRRFVVEFGWDVPAWERDDSWVFVDATTGFEETALVVGEQFDLTVLLHRIAAAVERVGAKRVAIDSLHVLFARYGDSIAVRNGLLRVTAGLERLGVTALVTLGRDEESDRLTTSGVEEYVADNLVILRNLREHESRRRTIEVLKLRGTTHRRGEFPFAITRARGVVVIPLSVRLTQPSGSRRISTGIPVLDEMCGGGLFQESVTMVSGPTGIGKTAVALQFALAGAQRGEPAVVVGFEESRDQLLRGISRWGYDVKAMEAAGKLRFLLDYPEVCTFEEHLVRIQAAIQAINAKRLMLDSLTSLHRSETDRAFREFAIGLTAYLKEQQIAGMLTTSGTGVVGADITATQEHVSALTDGIIVLRYVEVYGELKRGIAVLKMRGSEHQKTIREFTISAEGLQIGRPLRTTTGIMSGNTSQLDSAETARLAETLGQE